MCTTQKNIFASQFASQTVEDGKQCMQQKQVIRSCAIRGIQRDVAMDEKAATQKHRIVPGFLKLPSPWSWANAMSPPIAPLSSLEFAIAFMLSKNPIVSMLQLSCFLASQ
jgi:hypothetical protein